MISSFFRSTDDFTESSAADFCFDAFRSTDIIQKLKNLLPIILRCTYYVIKIIFIFILIHKMILLIITQHASY
jgi:hypothetical protein